MNFTQEEIEVQRYMMGLCGLNPEIIRISDLKLQEFLKNPNILLVGKILINFIINSNEKMVYFIWFFIDKAIICNIFKKKIRNNWLMEYNEWER